MLYSSRAYDFENHPGYLSAGRTEASIADHESIAETLKNMKISAVSLTQKRKRHPVMPVAERETLFESTRRLYGDTLDEVLTYRHGGECTLTVAVFRKDHTSRKEQAKNLARVISALFVSIKL